MTDILRNPPWPRCLAWLRRVEGGFIDHPADPGGATYAGVSLRAVVGLDMDGDGKLDFDLDRDGDVDADDIRALQRQPDLIERFYRERYWYPSKASEMPWPLNLYVFDAAVHHGPEAAVGLLQRALGVTFDGKPGPVTLAAARKATPLHGRRMLAERQVLFARIRARATYVELHRRGQQAASPQAFADAFAADPFLRGWMRRVTDLQAEAAYA